jgi:hypothetical protein
MEKIKCCIHFFFVCFLGTLFLVSLSALFFSNSLNAQPITTILNCLTGDVLWEQIPDSVDGTGVACQLDSVYPFEADVADDISIPSAGGRLDSIKTWWRNWSFSSWYYVPNFHLILYADSSGMPSDSPTYEFVIEKEHYTVYEHWPQEKFSIIMDLTTYFIEITDSGVWWIEIQPSNVFTGGNGQTG